MVEWLRGAAGAGNPRTEGKKNNREQQLRIYVQDREKKQNCGKVEKRTVYVIYKTISTFICCYDTFQPMGNVPLLLRVFLSLPVL